MTIALCIQNELKLQVLKQAAHSIFGNSCDFISIDIDRPHTETFGREAHRAVLEKIIEEAKEADQTADIYVCMLGGMEEQSDGLYEIAGVATKTKDGIKTFSSCTTFKIPPSAAEKVTAGMSFAKAIQDLFPENANREDGFISLLTQGAITKYDQYLQATIVALGGILQKELMQ